MLLHGAPGTGKSKAAEALGYEVGKPLKASLLPILCVFILCLIRMSICTSNAHTYTHIHMLSNARTHTHTHTHTAERQTQPIGSSAHGILTSWRTELR